MSVDLVAEVWNGLKHYIGTLDRAEAADVLVNLLVDSNFDADDIRSSFRGDSEIKKALQAYLADHAVENDEDEYEEDEYDDYDDEDEDY